MLLKFSLSGDEKRLTPFYTNNKGGLYPEVERIKQDGGNGSWVDQNAAKLKNKILMTLSMEANIPEFAGYDAQNANTRGGLGAYFGDKLEGLALIGLKSYGVQPMYSQITKDGRTIDVDYEELKRKGIILPVHNRQGKQLRLYVYGWDDADTNNPEKNILFEVEVYRISSGGTTDYLLWSPAQ